MQPRRRRSIAWAFARPTWPDPKPRVPGAKVVGPAVTLQFMPQREDVASGKAQEHVEKKSALWGVFDTVEAGDVLVVQAFGDPYTGTMGDMLTTYFMGRGGIGIVVDGSVRDWPKIRQMDLPLWTKGFTPNYASQTNLFPWAINVPIACSMVLVIPGDIIIADDDGAVVVPAKLAEFVLEQTIHHEEWEVFSRMRLREGGSIQKYYPLSDEGWEEYEAWKKDTRNRIMKITSIKTAATAGHGMHLWVKIDDRRRRHRALGECVHGGKQAIAIIGYLEEKLIGRDPFAIDAIFEDMRRSHVFDGGNAGALITALTGIEIALWDLKGKALETPIYELLGGKFRDKIRVYADCQVEPGMNFDEIRPGGRRCGGDGLYRAEDRRGHPRLRPHRQRSRRLSARTSSTTPPSSGSTSAWSSWSTW